MFHRCARINCTTSPMGHLKLLIWKNFLIQRRSIIWSLLELGLPLLFSCILLILRQSVYSSKQAHREYTSFDVSGTRDDFSQLVDGEAVQSACFNPFRIYYTPAGNFTDQIMAHVAENMKLSAVGIESEVQMEEIIMKEMDTLDPCSCSVYGGVAFHGGFNASSLNLHYDIRLSNVPRNMHSKQGEFNFGQASVFAVGVGWKTNELFAFPPLNGPRERNFSDGGKPGYWREGFLILQHAIDKAIVSTILGNESYKWPYKIQLHRFAYPPYTDNGFVTVIQQHLPVVILLSYALSVVYICRSIVTDKETRVREFMRVMGLNYSKHSLAHFLINFVKLAFISAMITMFLCVEVKGQRILDKSDPTVVYFFLLVYSITSLSYCFAVATFFNSGNVVAGCAGLMWCCLYWPYFFIQPRYSSVYRSTKLITCLLVNSAMSFGVQLIGILEGENVGLQWYNLFHKGTMYNNLSMIEVISMLLVDATICLALACCNVQALLGDRRKLAAVFTIQFYRNLLRNRNIRVNVDHCSNAEESGYFEKIIQPQRITVSIDHLCKIFQPNSGKVVALNDLNLQLYYGQITALLGHNGAGKSTTISILTGVQNATAGKVTVNGVDLRTGFKRICRFIGFCPQYNPLFDQLTVYEHLKFYCLLKRRPLITTELDRILHLLNLEEKRHWTADTLSGGMKRKLCVGMALIGGSEIVFLDEPTTGMDPQARHDAWRLLLEEKQYRTILLTTHFMEEADLLGDRIAVLSNGSLQCCGTSFFLKRQFGDGYRLKVIFKYLSTSSIESQVQRLLDHIKAFVPNASVISSVGTEALYVLPAIKGPTLQTLFIMLEESQAMLDIETFGLSVITMEEVFLRVTPGPKHSDNVDSSCSSSGSICSSEICLDEKLRVTGFKLKLQQFLAVFFKRSLDGRRNSLMMFVQTFVPLLFVIVAIMINQTLPDNKKITPLGVTIDSYGSTVVGLYADNDSVTIGQSYASQLSAAHTVQWLEDNNFTAFVLDNVQMLDQSVFDQKYIVAMSAWQEENDTYLCGYFNNQPLHAMPASLNAIDNGLFQLLAGNGTRVPKIVVTNRPLPPTELDSLVNWWETGISEFNIAFNLVFGFSFMVSFFLVYIIKERESGSKHLQILSNLPIGLYWLANFLWDIFVYMITVTAILITFALFKVDVLVGGDRWLHILLLMTLYGWATIWMMYFLSFFFSSPSSGYVKMTIFNLLSGLLTLVVITILLILDLKEVYTNLIWCFMALFPNFCLGQAMSAYYFNYFIASTCEPLVPFCDFTPGAFCCLADTFTTDQLQWARPGIGRFLFFLSMHGVVYSALVLLMEAKAFGKFSSSLANVARRWRQETIKRYLRIRHTFEGGLQQSLDVLACEVDGNVDESPLYAAPTFDENVVLDVRHICKRFGNFTAVKSISFHVNKGECFGLLGVNGSGKTTTFRMLSGETNITEGTVFVNGVNLHKHWLQAKSMIGYCPQFDALLEKLTVEETLTLYARLHGIHWSGVKAFVQRMVDTVNLSKHCSKQVGILSCGNKRKLSVAIALVGSPKLLLLDEPTSGVDPLSRRTMWRLLETVRKCGVSIVLTSHSMEECEALCGRLAVVLNGQVKCIGSPQQLKSKYGKGYLIVVKFAQETKMVGFLRAMEELFPNTSVEEIHGLQMRCLVPFQASTWSRLFEALETLAEPYGIVDYMLSQPSLEQIFLACSGV